MNLETILQHSNSNSNSNSVDQFIAYVLAKKIIQGGVGGKRVKLNPNTSSIFQKLGVGDKNLRTLIASYLPCEYVASIPFHLVQWEVLVNQRFPDLQIDSIDSIPIYNYEKKANKIPDPPQPNNTFRTEEQWKEVKYYKLYILMCQKKREIEFLGSTFDYWRKHKGAVLAVVKKSGYSLKYAADYLKKDKEVVLEAVKQDNNAFKYASPSLKRDKEFVLEAVKQNGWALKYADNSLKKDKKVVLAAVKQNGQTLGNADKSFTEDRKVVLEAVKQDAFALRFVSPLLKKDKKFMALARAQTSNSEIFDWFIR